MEEEIEVTITFTEKVTYSGTVRMTKAKFHEYEEQLEGDDYKAALKASEAIAGMLDRQSDWQDSDDIEIVVFGD